MVFSSAVRCGIDVKRLEYEADRLAPQPGPAVVVQRGQVGAGQFDAARVGRLQAAIRFSSVDLPAPDSPTIATVTPGSTVNDSPSRIVRPPYPLTSPLIVSMVCIIREKRDGRDDQD